MTFCEKRNPTRMTFLHSRRFWALAGLYFCTWAALAADPAPAVAPPWPQASSDLKPDATAVFGELPNGFRYIIIPNSEPPGRVSLRLRVHAGSLMEAEDQRGLAHYLEHAAFKGSTHFAPGTLIDDLQRMGMGFGTDTNGHTSFDETVFALDPPATSGKELTDCLQILRDYADGLLLQEDQIDGERGVILSEKRDRDNVGYRTFVESWNFYFPQALLPQREPIGLESVIKEAQRDRFVSFYQDWYTPDRLTLVAVGDVKPAELAPLITQYFGSLAARPARPGPDLGNFTTPGFAAKYYHDAEEPATQIALMAIAPFSRGPDNAARRTMELRLDAANFILSRRLERLSRQPNSPISKGDATDFTFLDAVEASLIETECQPAQWQAALNVTEQELRRALEYGFTQAEVDEARASMLNDYQEAARTASTRQSRDLSDEVADSLDDNRVFTSPADDLAWAQPQLAQLTPAQCLEALQAAWSQGGRRLFVSGSLDLPDADATLAAAYQKSAATALEKPADTGAQTFAYGATGTPGQVVERVEHPELGITQLRFANNVRVNLKPTNFEAGKVRVLVQFGGGSLDIPASQPALGLVAGAVFTEGGLGKHSAEDLERLLAGKTVGVDFGVDTDFFDLGGMTDAADLQLELELLRAYLTDPGYRPESLAEAQRQFPELYNSLREDVDAVLSNEAAKYLSGGDFRFGVPPQAQAMAVKLDDIRAWLAPLLANSYLEISLVGDFDPAQAEKALAATFGTLPPRALQRADYSAALTAKFPAQDAGTLKTFTAETVIPKAIATVYWPTCDMSDITRVRQLSVLGEILSDRLRVQIRMQLGEAYSPEARNVSSQVYPNYGYAFALCEADPKQAAGLDDKMQAIGAAAAKDGVTADEFQRALLPIRKSMTEYLRNNQYWLHRVVAGSQAYPQQLEWARTLPTAYDGITADQVSALAKQYLGADKVVRVLVTPVAPAASPVKP
jgi:zinc protease